MDRFRQLTLLTGRDAVRMAARFPRAAINMLRDCANSSHPAPFPRRLGLFLTNRCNFACPMCAVQDVRGVGMERGGDMPIELVDRVLRECEPHQPVVDLIGGEPLLYPHLREVVRISGRHKVLAAVTTNGLTLEHHADEFVRAELPILQVSLDGWDDASQAERGLVRNSFRRLCDGVRAVRQARGTRPFPIIRILTAITRINHAHLDRIQGVVADLGGHYWGVSNYFHLNRHAHRQHQEFALIHGLPGAVTAHAIPDDTYLTPQQVAALKASLQRVKRQNRRLRLGIAYAWSLDVDAYYSTRRPARTCRCDLPYTRLDIQTDGAMTACVSGKRLGDAHTDSVAEVWSGSRLRDYRRLYERTRPMPMCFRCCGLSQSIAFEPQRRQ